MCRLSEIRDNLIPIMEDMVKRRRFDESSEYTIGDPDNNERLQLVVDEDNLHNTVFAIILFEGIELQIGNSAAELDFQVNLKLGNDNHIDVYDLELLLAPDNVLENHTELEISKEIISCWNSNLHTV